MVHVDVNTYFFVAWRPTQLLMDLLSIFVLIFLWTVERVTMLLSYFYDSVCMMIMNKMLLSAADIDDVMVTFKFI